MVARRPLVAVLGLEPAFTAGLEYAAQDRFCVVTTGQAALGSVDRFLAALALDSAGDNGLATLVARFDPKPVVAITREDDPSHWVEVMAKGVAGIAPYADTPEGILDVLSHSLRGMFLLPVGILRWVVDRVHQPPSGLLSDRDTRVLVRLARGDTVADVATAEACAPRTMHRMLAQLYAKIGVDRIDGARRLAIRWGFADD
ncbi:MAG: hypothetical protein QY307_05605 [Acidimicrobiia bacterium]|nr:MAG: hypothetical protein QY307_05605 [Acidimicrobiia bacterium]